MKKYGLLSKFPSGLTILSTTVSPGARDTSAPVYQRAYINRSSAGNNVLELEFDDTVTSPSANYELGFTVECRIATGLWKTLSALKYTGTVSGSYIVFTFDSGSVKTFQGSHEIRVSYDQTVGDITDEAGNALESFTNDTTLTNSSTVDLLTGIVESWLLSNTSAAIDAANDLTNNNSATFVSGKLGNAVDLELDSNQTLSLVDNADVSFNDEDFSIACWVNHESVVAWMGHMVKANWSGGTPEWNLSLQGDSYFKFQVWSSLGVNTRVEWTSGPSTDTWYLVVGYLDTSTELGVSVNGATPITQAYTLGVRDSTQAFVLGGYSDYNSAGVFDGLIDDPTIWGKALSTAEITDLYNSGTGKAYPYIPDPTVLYSSGEIGVVGSETVEIAFTENVDTDSNYTTGVTIKVGTVTATIDSGTRQTDNSKVRYVLGAGVDGTETVTWEYLDSSGGIKSDLGLQLGDVSAQAITNTAFEPEDLAGTVHWWHVRPSLRNGVTGSDGDAISTWTEDAGSETFTQTLTARPTLQTNEINGLSVLRFDGINDNMVSDLTLTEIFANGAKTAWFVIKINTMGPGAVWYLSDGILTDQGGYWGAAVDSDEVVQGNFTGSNQEAKSAASIDTVYVVEMRHDSGTIYTSLNGGSETSTSSGNTTVLTNALRIGANYNAGVFFDGDIAEIVTSNQAESSANRTAMRDVLENIYGV